MLIEYDMALCAFQTVNIPFYILYAWTLVRYRKSRLASPFFALCLSSAVVDICHLIHFTSLYRLNIDGWPVARALLSNPTGPLPKYKLVGAFYLGQVQIFAAVLIALNRFTALAIPFKHDSIWSKKFLATTIGLQWMVPVGLFAPMLFSPIESQINNYSNRVEARVPDFKWKLIWFIYATTINGIVCNVLMLTLYSVAFYKAMARRRVAKIIARDKVELKLALFGLINFLLMSSYGILCIMMAMAYILKKSEEIYRQLIFHFIDIFCIVNPYIMLLCSQNIRRSFIETLCCRPVETTTISTICDQFPNQQSPNTPEEQQNT